MPKPQHAINDVFERVVLVNLDRRPERLAKVAAQLEHLGVSFERFPAIDGQDPAVTAEWRAYAQREPAVLGADVRPVSSWRQFYLDYDSDAARVAFFEAERGRAIATPGAWGLLRSMSAVIGRAVSEGWRSVLVLEDDVLFHKDTLALFERCMTQLPADWKILQLGAMQLHWQSEWISWYSDNLYRCNGSSFAAHAYGVRGEVLAELLECCQARDLPFDIGALHTVKRRHAAACFTAFPNIAIQGASASDIGSSTMFHQEVRKTDNAYRWHLPDYGLDAMRKQARRAPPEPLAEAESAAPPPAAPPPLAALPAWRGILSRLGRHSWVGRRPAEAPAAANRPRAAPAKTAPARPLGGQPPLKVRSLKKAKEHAIISLTVGLEGDELVRVLDLMRAERGRRDVEPILITDCDRFELFRARALAFEYLPSPALRLQMAPQLDWELYVLRRLALLRRKWQPVRIVAFGPVAAQLLQDWKTSPFEDESIDRVVAAAAKAPEPA